MTATVTKEFIAEKAREAVAELQGNDAFLSQVLAAREAIIVELDENGDGDVITMTRSKLYRSLEQAVKAGELNRQLCNAQLHKFKHGGGVPCVIHVAGKADKGTTVFWSFHRFSPPKAD